MRARKDCAPWHSTAARSAARPAPRQRIENYLGFPTGISGMALMARAYNQAQKFGVEMAIPDEVTGLDPAAFARDGRFLLNLSNGEHASARAVVIASGARYRRLAVANLEEFEGTSVHYWASPIEARRATYSCSSAPIPTRTGWRARASRSTLRASC
jgi:thioredoxin reductase